MGGSLMSRQPYRIEEDAPVFEPRRVRRATVGAFAKREARAASGASRRAARAKSASRKGQG